MFAAPGLLSRCDGCVLAVICVGLFPSYPQGGNEQGWAQEAAGLVQRWQPRFGTVGLSLSLQHARYGQFLVSGTTDDSLLLQHAWL